MIRQFTIDINIPDTNGSDSSALDSDDNKRRQLKCVSKNEQLHKSQAEYQLFVSTADAFDIVKAVCPKCLSHGEQKPHGTYPRWLITREDGVRCERYVDVNRTICGVCEKTHAILPDAVIPYMQHSLMFVLEVMWQYRRRRETGETIRGICQNYGISTSTMYEWKSKFTTHVELDIGAVADESEVEDRYWPPGGAILSGVIKEFYQRHGFSFMQAAKPATQSKEAREHVAPSKVVPHTSGTDKSHDMNYPLSASNINTETEVKHGKSKGPLSDGPVQIRGSGAAGTEYVSGCVSDGILQEVGVDATDSTGWDSAQIRFKNDCKVGVTLYGRGAGDADNAAAQRQRRRPRIGSRRGVEGVRHQREIPEIAGDTS